MFWTRCCCALLLTGCSAPPGASDPDVTGVVFHDRDRDGRRDSGEPGIAKVAVSNGREVVLTDSEGQYRLPVVPDCALFVIQPSGWKVPVRSGTNLPVHYYLHKPEGSPTLKYEGVEPTGPRPASIDFALYESARRDRFDMLCFGDIQPRDQQEVDFLSHDIVEELIGADAAFGVTLGDLVFDDLNMFEPVARSVGRIGLPWHHLFGNHDQNYDAPAVHQADETYERTFGPSRYAFNHGQVHFLVLNDVKLEVGSTRYHAELGERQLAFIENDLRHVPRERLVVLLMHIPLDQVRDRAALYALLAEYPHTFSLSAHTHTQYHLFLNEPGWTRTEPHHHLVHGTACGSWWTGVPDAHGIPHATMSDGTPNGYSVIRFDGNRYAIDWKVARRPAGYQMKIHAPEVVELMRAQETEVIVNVFAGSERSRVELRLGEQGEWVEMELSPGVDPGMDRLHRDSRGLGNAVAEERQAGSAEALDDRGRGRILDRLRPYLGRRLGRPSECAHLWTARLPSPGSAGSQVLYVRETDQFGRQNRGLRVIRFE